MKTSYRLLLPKHYTSGTGSATLIYSYTANGNVSSRPATITVGGQTFTVTQNGVNGSITLTPATDSVPANGAIGKTVSVTTNAPDYTWTATSNAAWLTITAGANGTGSGSVTYNASANTSANARTGALTIGGLTFTVTQSGVTPAYTLATATGTAPATAGNGTVGLTVTPSDATWTATSNAAWLTVSPANGTGPATLTYSYTGNGNIASRNGTITVASQTFTLTQSGLTGGVTLTPSSDTAPAAGATGKTVAVTANAADYSWTAISNTAWLTITSGAASTGSGIVTFNVAANTSVNSRTGTLTIGGQTFTVTQSGVTPAYTLASTTGTAPATAGSGTVSLTATPSDATWTATSNAAWLTVSPSSGTGPATLTYTYNAATTIASRTGTFTVAGQTFTLTQTGLTGSLTLTPASDSAPAAGATGKTVAVTANAADFAWTATSNAVWLTITAGASTTGSGTVTYNVTANPSANSRTGTLTIGGQTFTVTQAGQTSVTAISGISPSPAIVGQLYTVSYTVTATTGAVSGNVTVSDGTSSKTCLAAAGQCALASSTTGPKTITVTFAGDATLQGSSTTSALTVNSPASVQPVAIEQTSGSSGRPQLQFTAAHPVSAASIPYTQFLITRTALDARNACYVSYDTVANVFYLLNDDMTTWFGLLAGTGNTVGNSQCTIYGAGSGATKVGQLTRTNLDVSFRGGFAGTKSVYQLAGDSNGGNSGWQLMGTWTDTGDPNVLEITTMTPAAGAGASTVVTANVRKGDGVAKIAFVQFVMNAGLNGFNACFIHYDRASNAFFLLKDDASGWFGLIGGSAAQVENSQCVLKGVGSGGTSTVDTLSINYNLQFKTAFTGSRNIYLQAVDNTGVIQSWKQAGTWTVSGATLASASGPAPMTARNRGGNSLSAPAARAFETPRQYQVIQQGGVLLVGPEEADPASPGAARESKRKRVEQ